MGITLEGVNYTYQAGTPFEGRALFDINLTIKEGSYTAFIGHTGSGKSTIMQLLNGLNIPTEGAVIVDDIKITANSKNKEIKPVRKKVGLVFQFPESQLFEETVLKDVAFGPQNFGVSIGEAEQLAREKLAMVGIHEEFFEKNPFELSGGQMRRVAIAGILAMEPEILVLDEPTAGLDPKGRRELMTLFKELHQNGMTIVLVTLPIMLIMLMFLKVVNWSAQATLKKSSKMLHFLKVNNLVFLKLQNLLNNLLNAAYI